MNHLSLIFSLLFCFTACSTSKNNTSANMDYPKGQLMILLSENTPPENLSKSFAQYQLIHESPVSKHENKWMYSFNEDKVSLKKLIMELGNVSIVENVEKVKTAASNDIKVTSGTSGKKGKVNIRNK